MDGSSSASTSDPESLERTTRARPSDAERELNDLRARAYGPESDIEDDPAAMARLIELEAAHVVAATPFHATAAVVTAPVDSRARDAAPTSVPAHESVAANPAAQTAKPVPPNSRGGSGRSLWRRANLTPIRERFVLGSIVVATILGFAAWLLAPHPDATLQLSAGEVDMFVETVIAQDEDPDISTLRPFEPYQGIDVWSVQVSSIENGLGICLIAWDRVGAAADFSMSASPLGWNSPSI